VSVYKKYIFILTRGYLEVILVLFCRQRILYIHTGLYYQNLYFFFLAPNDPDDDDRYGGCPFSLGWGTGDRGSGIEDRGSRIGCVAATTYRDNDDHDGGESIMMMMEYVGSYKLELLGGDA